MSMILQMRRCSPNALAALSDDESAAHAFVSPTDDSDPAFGDGSIMDLGKAWHAIHFLLTKTAWEMPKPAGSLLAGAEVGADFGYGPATILSASEVVKFTDLLAGLPEDFVQSELDFDTLHAADIYPFIWDRKDPTDIEYTSFFFDRLKKFVAEAASRGEGIAKIMI